LNLNVPNPVREAIAAHPYPLLFVTVSGAHLYGFASRDSDWDLRGVHVLPPCEVMALEPTRDTIEEDGIKAGTELDLVTHDARKFFGLLLKRNGYVLEQLYSPLVLHSTPEHKELKEIACGCITRHHSHHYLGFAATQWQLFEKEQPRRVKPLLYTFRVLLTGIHLMQTGSVEANLRVLNESFRLPYIPDLIERKSGGQEKSVLQDADSSFYRAEYERLVRELELASERSSLPQLPTARQRLSELLLRLRETYVGTRRIVL
jgi:predicted nucleotidyltransferase